MKTLPVEIWVKIFGYVSRKNLLSLMLVSRYMNEIAHDPQLWKNIRFYGPINFRPKKPRQGILVDRSMPLKSERYFYNAVVKASMLRVIKIFNYELEFGDEIFSILSEHCHAVEKIDIPYKCLNDTGILEKLVEKCPKIKDIRLYGIRSPQEYQCLSKLDDLEFVSLEGTYWGYGIPPQQRLVWKDICASCLKLSSIHITYAGIDKELLIHLLSTFQHQIEGLTIKMSKLDKEGSDLLNHYGLPKEFCVIEPLRRRRLC